MGNAMQVTHTISSFARLRAACMGGHLMKQIIHTQLHIVRIIVQLIWYPRHTWSTVFFPYTPEPIGRIIHATPPQNNCQAGNRLMMCVFELRLCP
jgi:hypothetical protein